MKMGSANKNPTTLRNGSGGNTLTISIRTGIHLSGHGQPNVVLDTLVGNTGFNESDGVRTLGTEQIYCHFCPTIIPRLSFTHRCTSLGGFGSQSAANKEQE
jgi:hypothetical protein